MTRSMPGSARTEQSGTNSMQAFLRSPASDFSGSPSSGTSSTSRQSTEIVIEDLESIDDMRVVEDLQKEVWTLHDRDITPLTQLVAAKHAGGQLIGARDGGALVGFVYGFVGLEGGRTIHHSHMLAVKP